MCEHCGTGPDCCVCDRDENRPARVTVRQVEPSGLFTWEIYRGRALVAGSLREFDSFADADADAATVRAASNTTTTQR